MTSIRYRHSSFLRHRGSSTPFSGPITWVVSIARTRGTVTTRRRTRATDRPWFKDSSCLRPLYSCIYRRPPTGRSSPTTTSPRVSVSVPSVRRPRLFVGGLRETIGSPEPPS